MCKEEQAGALCNLIEITWSGLEPEMLTTTTLAKPT